MACEIRTETLERQIFTRRAALLENRFAPTGQIRVSAKDNGNGTATVWFADGSKDTAVPLSRLEFLS